MTTDEEQDEGQVSFRVYWAYFKAGSGLLAVVILIVLSAAEGHESVAAGIYPMLCTYLASGKTLLFSSTVTRGGMYASYVLLRVTRATAHSF